MITEHDIDLAERFFESLDADTSRIFFENFSESQPNLFVYVMAMSENLQSEEAQYDSLYLTGVIYKAFETRYALIRQISEHEVDETEQEIIALYETLSDDELNSSESDLRTVLTESTQPFLLAFIGNAISSAEEEYSEEDQGLAFNILQTVIESFNKSVQNKGLHIIK
jgi:hypothetical protein